MNCPFCNSDDVECDTVDIGVGEIQCGPAVCCECGAFQEQDEKLGYPIWKQTRMPGLFKSKRVRLPRIPSAANLQGVTMNDIMKRSRNSQVEILGRAFVYDTGDPDTIDLWEHDFEPMGEDGRSRSGADWALEHLFECGNALRSMFNLPAEGNFQVLFKGRMEGWWCGEYGGADEWDQDFIVFEFTTKPIPEEYMKFLETAT